MSTRSRLKRTVFTALGAIRNERVLDGFADLLVRLTSLFDGCRRQIRARKAGPVNDLPRSVLESHPPWAGAATVRHPDVPAMINDEESDYYVWLMSRYSKRGAVVELGPWLGSSTCYLVDGLRKSPDFDRKQRMFVFDDFVWRSSWMDAFMSVNTRPGNHDSFRHLFDENTGAYAESLSVTRARISDYDGNESIPSMTWSEGLIEFLVVDCGRTIDANRAWWDLLSPFFIPGRSLLILEDWQTHTAVPRQWFNQMKLFTDERSDQLELVHELLSGDVATFLYTGHA